MTLFRSLCAQLKHFITHHKDDGEEDTGDEHDGEAVNEPGAPVDTVAQAHHPHGLLQPAR